ncbi:MAG: glycosyltransferase family 2 protein, partial [bacterium]|nr:glycosyltransferase family 2 protein [bacterium]
MTRFQVIIRGYNCKEYLSACLKSLIRQSYTNWKALVILDAPTDKSHKVALKWASKDSRIKVWLNSKRKGVAYNIWWGMKYAEPKPEDVIAWLDADDELYEFALKIVAKKYEKRPNLRATYGSYYRPDLKRRTKISKPYNKDKSVRKQPWRGSHLKTFKYKLMRHFPQD